MSNNPSRSATLHDVARLARVSYQTVSRVINNNPNVAVETRLRVQEAIHQLDYRPNRAARSLITGRSQTLQIISFNPAFYKPMRFFIQAAREQGYHVGISTLNDPHSIEELNKLMDELTAGMVDGFLFFEPPFQLVFEEVNRMCRRVPFVQIGSCPCPGIPVIVFDQEHGCLQVLQHLYNLGHRQIAEVSGLLENYDGRKRHETYLAFMKSKGLKPGPSAETNFTTPSGYEATCRILQSGEKFTALVCGNDEVALGALHALHEAKMRIPEDVSVVGFDDDIDVAYFEPPLTTVQQDFAAQARQSIQYIVTLIEQPNTPHYQQIIYPKLLIRKSTCQLN